MTNQLAQQRAATESMMKRSAEASRDLMASADATRLRSDALAGGPYQGQGQVQRQRPGRWAVFKTPTEIRRLVSEGGGQEGCSRRQTLKPTSESFRLR